MNYGLDYFRLCCLMLNNCLFTQRRASAFIRRSFSLLILVAVMLALSAVLALGWAYAGSSPLPAPQDVGFWNTTGRLTPQASDTATDQPIVDMDAVCQQLVLTFNSINTILPMNIDFDGGEAVGIQYPPGRVVLTSSAREVEGCISYQFPSSSAVIAHLEIKDNMEIQFPYFEINGENTSLSLDIKGCHVVLHYSMLQRTSEERNTLDMSVLMGELRSLGEVTMKSDIPGLNGRNFTREAEDLIRPKLFEAFNQFAKEELHWVVDPSGKDSSLDGFNAFKLIFKRQMIQLQGAFGL